jgi:proton-coupled amino acid transporter
MEILLKKIEAKIAKGRNMKEITLRTIIIILTGAVGIAVPDLEPVISLVGAVFFSGLGLFVSFPSTFSCDLLSIKFPF